MDNKRGENDRLLSVSIRIQAGDTNCRISARPIEIYRQHYLRTAGGYRKNKLCSDFYVPGMRLGSKLLILQDGSIKKLILIRNSGKNHSK